jgi:hypothetical protein
MFPNLCPKKFDVTIAPETPSIGTGIRVKEMEIRKNWGTRQILETKNPVVTSGSVNKHKGVPKATHQDAVTKGNINVDNVEVEWLFAVNGSTPRSFQDHRKHAQQYQELPSINPLAVKAGMNDMFVVTGPTGAKSTMKLLWNPVSFSIGSIRPITWTNWWKSRTKTMYQLNHLLMWERGEKLGSNRIRTQRRRRRDHEARKPIQQDLEMFGYESQIVHQECCWLSPTKLFWNQGEKRGKLQLRVNNGRRRVIVDVTSNLGNQTIVLNQNRIARETKLRRGFSACTCVEGRALSRVKDGWTPRLNVVERRQRGRLAKRFIRQMAVGGHVHVENHSQEVHMHPRSKAFDESAARLTKVGPKAVERNS